MVQSAKHGYLFDDTPRGILEALLVTGGIVVALSAGPALFAALAAAGYVIRADDRIRRKKLQRSFQYLTRQHYVNKRTAGKMVHLELTAYGRTRITHYLNRRSLLAPVERPRAWDKKWRLIMFDISAEERSKRNAFRSLISRLGAVMFQKSVWIHPFDCSDQINLLRNFFKLSDEELRLVVAHSIGRDRAFREHFKV